MSKLKSLADWFDNRTGCRRLVHAALFEHIPGGARWRYVWGSTLIFTFTVQAITGIFLWMAYSPSSTTAWESVYYIQHQMLGGWLLRGLHHFTAQAMVVLLVLHLMQVVIDGAYRAPREVNYWLGLVLMLLVLGLSLTGYLLPWDQKGYWATRVATNLSSLVNQRLPDLAVGGSDYGHHTLTRFFALHAGLLPALIVLFLIMHIALFRRHGIMHKTPVKAPDCTFWPDQVLRDAIACLAVLAVVVYLIFRPALPTFLGGAGLPATPSHLGAELGAPADPANAYSAARPEWYFLFLFQFLKLFEGHGETGEFLGAIVVPGVVMLFMFLIPIFGKWTLGHRFNIAFVLILLGGIGWLTVSAYIEDHRAKWTDPAQFAQIEPLVRKLADDRQIEAHFQGNKDKIAEFLEQKAAFEKYEKSEKYLRAVDRAEEDADRAKELAGRPTLIPPTGALSMVNEDSKIQGRRLFDQNCSGCHTHFDPDAPDAETIHKNQLDRASAPNLYGFAGRRWFERLLDPKLIAGPQFFGHTKLVKSDMVDFVNDTWTDSKTWSPEQKKQVIAALVAETDLPGHAAPAAAEQETIKKGQALLKDADRCGQCHNFHAKDTGSFTAPDLTGYGTKAWLTAFVAEPAHKRFYGDNNDRMPSFGKGKLTPKQIAFIANWLRGDDDAPAE